jgi:hypothetical protein
MLSRRQALLSPLALFTRCDLELDMGRPLMKKLEPYVPRDINHVLGTGQSLSVGATSTAASTTQPYGNLKLSGGVIATAGFESPLLPLVEGGAPDPNVETMSSAMANLVSELCLPDLTHNMLVSVHGAGGTPYSGLKKGTSFYDQGMDQVVSGRDRAADDDLSYVVRAVTCVHGESDATDGNTNYDDDLIEWQNDYETDVRALTGQTEAIPMLISQNSSMATAITPQLMLDAHIAAPRKVVLVGAKYHLPYSDGTHLTTAGYRQMGEDYAKVFKHIIIDRRVWEPVRPRTVERVGNVITVVFYVPHPPLVFDEDLVDSTPDMGFGFVNHASTPPAAVAGGSAPAITNVEIIAPTTVRITLDGEPSVPCRLRYAIDTVPGFGPRGNLRDSDPTESRFGFSLYNWAVQFEYLMS